VQANPTNDRLNFILKTYGTKRPDIVMAMVDIIGHTVGSDRWIEHVADYLRPDEREQLDKWRLHGVAVSSELAAKVVSNVNLLRTFQTKHRADPLFPWMATRLSKVDKATMQNWKLRLRRGGTMLAYWYEANRPNLSDYDLNEAWQEAEEWYEESGPIEQGEVVQELEDGWTAQKLTTKSQLDREGQVMQHCVGSYYDEVKRGGTTIYSLRDANGRPHVTIEVKRKRVEQAKGKQNATPAKKYQKYVDEFYSWLEDEGIRTAKYAANLREIAELLENETDADEGAIEVYAHDWYEQVSHDVEVVKRWLSVLSYHEAELAGALAAEDVSPEELAGWPYLIVSDLLEYGGSGPGWLDDAVLVARMAVTLNRLRDSRDPEGEESRQVELFEPARQKKKRMSGHDPLEIEKGGRSFIPSLIKKKWRGDDDRGWDYTDYSHDTELETMIYPAEEWVAAGFDARDDRDGYVGPWFLHRFTPKEADDWWTDAGIRDGELAYQLRRRRVKPEMIEKSSAKDEIDSLFDDYERRATATVLKLSGDEAHKERARLAGVFAQEIAAIVTNVTRNKRRSSRRSSRRR